MRRSRYKSKKNILKNAILIKYIVLLKKCRIFTLVIKCVTEYIENIILLTIKRFFV